MYYKCVVLRLKKNSPYTRSYISHVMRGGWGKEGGQTVSSFERMRSPLKVKGWSQDRSLCLLPCRLNIFQRIQFLKNIIIGSSIVQCTCQTHQEEEEVEREEGGGERGSFWIFQVAQPWPCLLYTLLCVCCGHRGDSCLSLCRLWPACDLKCQPEAGRPSVS